MIVTKSFKYRQLALIFFQLIRGDCFNWLVFVLDELNNVFFRQTFLFSDESVTEALLKCTSASNTPDCTSLSALIRRSVNIESRREWKTQTECSRATALFVKKQETKFGLALIDTNAACSNRGILFLTLNCGWGRQKSNVIPYCCR